MTHNAKEWIYKPNSFNIETVQGCNRRCEFCGTMGMEKVLHFVEMNTIKHTLKLIQEANYVPRIRLGAHGEPTLHPNICNIVKAIRTALPKSPISLFTNGTVIAKKPELIDGLFRAGLNNLIVDEYSDSPMGKFIRANPIAQKYKIVEQGEGTSLLIGIKNSDKRICIVPPIDGDNNTINRRICNQCGAATPPLKKPMNKKCSVIFREMTIRWDGNIAICCNDFRGYYFVTNIMECKHLEDAWFHPRFESARKILYKGERSFFPCNVCNVRGNRVGLLPDCAGKKDMPKPTEKDYEIARKVYPPLAVIEKRSWEK